jgi:hypothetical protein
MNLCSNQVYFPALIFAHLFFCAAAIFFLPAADIFRRALTFVFPSRTWRTPVNFLISSLIAWCDGLQAHGLPPRVRSCDRKDSMQFGSPDISVCQGSA